MTFSVQNHSACDPAFQTHFLKACGSTTSLISTHSDSWFWDIADFLHICFISLNTGVALGRPLPNTRAISGIFPLMQ
jgi:hypothetical protein